MARQPAFIVQEHESGLFLCPFDGSVGFTPLVRDAGPFDDMEEAVITATDFCDGPFTVLEIFVRPS